MRKNDPIIPREEPLIPFRRVSTWGVTWGVKKKPAFSAGRVDCHGIRFSLLEPEFIFVGDVFLIRGEDGRLRREQ